MTAWVPILALVGGVFFLILVSVFLKYRARKKEMEMKAEDRLREEMLEKVLLNGRTPNRPEEDSTISAKPIEVDYKGSNKKVAEGWNSGPMLQITEYNALSKKKYMLNPEERILIGSETKKNSIVISDTNVFGYQCEIFKYGEEICIRNMEPSFKAYLKRGKQTMDIGLQTIVLKSGDVLTVGTVSLKIDFVKIRR